MRLSLGLFTIFLAVSAPLSGCASNGDPRDPFESYNRSVHSFNQAVDDAALKPIAEGYVAVVPSPVRTGVRNFFSNLDDVVVFANDVLQLKGESATSDFLRVVFNSSFGLMGLLDIASEMGLQKHDEDFGQTLGFWGVSSGPYFVIPLLGPSTIRDTTGLVVDNVYIDPVTFTKEEELRLGALTVRIISRRADLLDAKRVIDMAALDNYEFTRDVYLEHRLSKVYDGKPPQQAE